MIYKSNTEVGASKVASQPVSQRLHTKTIHYHINIIGYHDCNWNWCHSICDVVMQSDRNDYVDVSRWWLLHGKNRRNNNQLNKMSQWSNWKIVFFSSFPLPLLYHTCDEVTTMWKSIFIERSSQSIDRSIASNHSHSILFSFHSIFISFFLSHLVPEVWHLYVPISCQIKITFEFWATTEKIYMI